ncbi:MAG: DUF1848 domain-containing protein [Thermodesulfobacteriota bacterium]
MIISASRRTDLPAWYSAWFMNRVRSGWCLAANPFNPKQVTRISLQPDEVDVFVFWTRNPRPMLPGLAELDERGYRYYFLFTVTPYAQDLEPHLPPLEERLAAFVQLSDRLGPERVIWRYDPIIISNVTDHDFHRRSFERLSGALRASTRRVIISLVHYYAKTIRNLRPLEGQGFQFDLEAADRPATLALLRDLADMARARGLEIYTCAEKKDYTELGLKPGRCLDGDLIEKLWGLGRVRPKDPGQRETCGCAASKDIGATDTCLHGCRYCYATVSFEAARRRQAGHDPASPILIGQPEVGQPTPPAG